MAGVELALLGGSVITVDPAQPRAEAVAVAGGRIVAVGSDREIRELIGPATDVIELDGRTVLPGFQDAHLHFAHGGMAARECDLYETTTPAEHAEAIVAYAARNPDGAVDRRRRLVDGRLRRPDADRRIPRRARPRPTGRASDAGRPHVLGQHARARARRDHGERCPTRSAA